jgi:aryl-alcohol dehydrogenase-like predicted oxidoreductase
VELRALGDSDLEVSAISLGSWLTIAGGVARDQAEACTRAAFDAGVTFFDTANVYGAGAAETAWGEILSGYPRDSYVLATKLFWPVSEGERGGLSAAEVHAQLDASLARLRTDHVDLYQCHRFDTEVPIEETMEALTDVVRAGKARQIGFSEWTAQQIEAALAVSARDGLVKFVSSQPQYSALWRAPEDGVFDVCRANGISHVVWSPLAQGVLTGKYRPGSAPPADSRAASDEMAFSIGRFMADPILEAVQRLVPIARDAGLSMAQLALAWVLSHEEVASAIIGATRPEQVADDVAAAEATLAPDVVEAVDAALADVAVTDFRLAYGAREGVLHR